MFGVPYLKTSDSTASRMYISLQIVLVELIFSINRDFFDKPATGKSSHFRGEKSRVHQTVPFFYAIKRDQALYLDINERDAIFGSADYFLHLH